jgi:hypothetical protein
MHEKLENIYEVGLFLYESPTVNLTCNDLKKRFVLIMS